MDENQIKHRLNAADIITLIRIFGAILLLIFKPLSAKFFLVYALTGITDVLDGWVARRLKINDDFGAKIDSVADLLFYAVTLFRVLPILWDLLPTEIWYAVAVVFGLRISAYITVAIKYRRFTSLHTYLNKLMGMAVFLIPFMLITQYAVGYCFAVSAVAAIASLEELVIHLMKPNYNADTKSVF